MVIQGIAPNWEKYVELLKKRQAFLPAFTQNGLCAVEKDYIAAGALFFPADRLIVAEFLVTNPEIPMWERHKAVVELARAFLLHAAASGRSPWIMVRHRGVARALERAGYKSNGAVLYEA